MKDRMRNKKINCGSEVSSFTKSKLGSETSLSFFPIPAMINVPGKIPKEVVKKNTLNGTANIAGVKFTNQKGKIGMNRRNNRYLTWFFRIPLLISPNNELDFNFSSMVGLSPA